MLTESKLIGKVLYFNQRDYDRTINCYKQVIRVINEVAVDFEKYNFGVFTQNEYDDIVSNGAKNLKLRYKANVVQSIENLKIASPTVRENMISQAAKDMNELGYKIDGPQGFFEKFQTTAGSSMSENLSIRLENISIVDAQAVIDEKLTDIIKMNVTSAIETETQAAVYQKFLEIKPIFDQMANLLKESKSDCMIFDLVPTNDAILYIDDDGHLAFAGALIKLVN